MTLVLHKILLWAAWEMRGFTGFLQNTRSQIYLSKDHLLYNLLSGMSYVLKDKNIH